jgi:hypothetical protein
MKLEFSSPCSKRIFDVLRRIRFASLVYLGAWATLAQPATTDPVLTWNAVMIDAIRADDSAPTLSTRNLAILHSAIYDAVNSILQTHQPYRISVPAPPDSSPEAAALAAGREVLLALYPSFSVRTESTFDSYLSLLPTSPGVTNGLTVGTSVADQILEWRAADGSATTVPYIPSDAPGQWRRTPPFFRPPVDPQWGFVEPFCLPDIGPFVPPGPPALTSAAYATAFNEVKLIGAKNSQTRTAEQSQIAVFWSDFSYTAMPPGHWNEIAAAIAQNQGNTMADNARLFALLNLAQADAAIVCWKGKYQFNFWRPITAIPRADEDGNPATDSDTNWNCFLPTPSFPEYTSGHSTFSKASAQVLTHFFGTDALSFSIGSDSLPGVYRSFTSVAACGDEVGMSRIYGGFHFQFSNHDGQACGGKIGDYVMANFLPANNQLPKLVYDRTTGSFRVHGHLGQACIVEVSSDLRRWQPLSTNTAVPGGTAVIDPQALSAAARFYRARTAP